MNQVYITAGVVPHPSDNSPVPVVALRLADYTAGETLFRTLHPDYKAKHISTWAGHSLPPMAYQLPELRMLISFDGDERRGSISIYTTGTAGALCREAQIGFAVEVRAFVEAFEEVGYYLLFYSDPVDVSEFRMDLPCYLGTDVVLSEVGSPEAHAGLRQKAQEALRLLETE